MKTQNLEASAVVALRQIARNEDIKAYVLQNPPLYKVLFRAARRFIGGETLSQCLETGRALNDQGFATSIDYMGESTRNATTAEQATEEFIRIVEAIAQQTLNSSVSLDLSHIGLAVDSELAFKNASVIAQATQKVGIEMMISMEGSERTQQILDVYHQLSDHYPHVGITLQAALHRTPADLEWVLQQPGRIRLVKGAYAESAEIAKPRGEALDMAYQALLETLLASSHACSIATHDPNLLESAHKFIQQQRLDCSQIEFEMLYGVTPERLEMMKRSYHTRVYLPYGQEWYLYLCHRLAEHPPNVYQALVDAAMETKG